MFNSYSTRRTTTALQDNPVGDFGSDIEDLLEVGPYVKALAQFAGSCDTPMTIAIQGDWGSGKTSLMNMVRKHLGGTEMSGQIETMWFNTWQFSQFKLEDDVATTMLSGFLDELGDDGQNVKEVFRKIGTKTAQGTGHLLKMLADMAAGGGGDALKATVDKLAQRENGVARQLRDLKLQITEAVRSVLKKKNADRLVVFIDDLDRIVPERAIELLETIKMFMDVPGVVYVLALDYAVVKRGLKKKFDIDENDLGGRSFFDKIIQLPFTMPTANYKIGGYLKELLRQVDFEFSDDDLTVYEELIRHSIGFNPRSAKRLVNVMKIYRLVESAKAETVDRSSNDISDAAGYRNRVLFALVCLQTAFEPAFHYLRANLDAQKLAEVMNGELEGIRKAYENSDTPAAFDRAKRRINEFLEAFFKAIDRNNNNEPDENEIAVLRSVMQNLAITSVNEEQNQDSELPDYRSLGKMNVKSILTHDEKKSLINEIAWYVSRSSPFAKYSTRSVSMYLAKSDASALVEDSVPGYKEFGTPEGIGNVTVGDAKRYDFYDLIGEIINVDIQILKNVLSGAKGQTKLRNAFKGSELEWPV